MRETCAYCGSSWNIEDEHVRARSKGGQATIPACAACNGSKGSKALMEWLRWVRENDSYRWRRIRDHHEGRRTEISQKVHRVRDEG